MTRIDKNKYYCRSCRNLTRHKTLYSQKIGKNYTYDDDDEICWSEEYKTIQCEGCETLAFAKVYSDQTMIEYLGGEEFRYYDNIDFYPQFLENGNELKHIEYIPKEIATIYRETIQALKTKSYILAAVGFRSIIEATCNNLKIKDEKLKQKINSLGNNGHISIKEANRLHSIRFLGNDAVHEIEKPSYKMLLVVLEIVNHLLSTLYINDTLVNETLNTLVKTESNFYFLVLSKLKKEQLDKIITIKELLGKDLERIEKIDLQKFEIDLYKKIKNKEFNYLSYEKTSPKQVKHYRITKIPENNNTINFKIINQLYK